MPSTLISSTTNPSKRRTAVKFLTEEGKIEEGTPLTDEQVGQRERMITWFHEEACGGAYHGVYGDKKCETLANAYVTGVMAKAAIPEAAPIPEPETIMAAPKTR